MTSLPQRASAQKETVNTGNVFGSNGFLQFLRANVDDGAGWSDPTGSQPRHVRSDT